MYQLRLRSECSPSLSVISAAFIAFGRSWKTNIFVSKIKMLRSSDLPVFYQFIDVSIPNILLFLKQSTKNSMSATGQIFRLAKILQNSCGGLCKTNDLLLFQERRDISSLAKKSTYTPPSLNHHQKRLCKLVLQPARTPAGQPGSAQRHLPALSGIRTHTCEHSWPGNTCVNQLCYLDVDVRSG